MKPVRKNRLWLAGRGSRHGPSAAEPTAQALPSSVDHTNCALYSPGHNVHFIQAKLAWEGNPAEYREGTLVSVEDDGWITVVVDGDVLRFWSHDPERARRCFEESRGQVGLPGWHLLHAPSASGGRYCICVANDEATPCAPTPTAGVSPAGLFERAMSQGGFLVSGIEAVRHLHDDEADNERRS